MTTLSFTHEQLRILQTIVSHALTNKTEAEEELDISLDGIDAIEFMLYAGEQTNLNLELFI